MVSRIEFNHEERARLVARVPEVKHALLGNLEQFSQYAKSKLLKVGDVYAGIWLEHNQDNLFLVNYAPEEAWASQDVFMKYQQNDGLFPFAMMSAVRPDELSAPALYSHLQCVYPFTRCAMQIAIETKRQIKDFKRIYSAGCRYDQWIEKNRNRAGTGLVEAYCEWDTGHDNSPRVTDGKIPHSCPDNYAANMPDIPIMPILSVDLSAMVYGNRKALAELAVILEYTEEKLFWERKAQCMRNAIMEYLYDPDDEFYYDRDRNGFRKYRTEHVTRLFLNEVLTQDEFDRIWERYFSLPGKGFCCEFPIPAVAIDDPHFDGTCSKNSWGGNTQGLTTLRALLWMDKYGRQDDMDAILSRWLKSALLYNSHFPQEINPFSGKPVGNAENYSPALLIYLEAIKRLGIAA
jgi:hypothetical protein